MRKLCYSLFAATVITMANQALAQFGDCLYQHELEQPTELIHEVKLPPTAFAKTSGDRYNFRVYGVAASGDTLEMPYAYPNPRAMAISLPLKQLNAGKIPFGNRFTFELEEVQQIQSLELEIANSDFEGLVTLEGADRLGDWQQVLDHYRIIDLSTNGEPYRFTTLKFTPSLYRFYRISIQGIKNLDLQSVNALRRPVSKADTLLFEGALNKLPKRTEFHKTTVYELNLPEEVLIDHLRFNIADTLRYVRFVEVQILQDSFKQGEELTYRYRTIGSGSLSSLDPSQPLGFVATVARRVRILIHNQDNQPLTVANIEAGLQQPRINARFAGAEKYYLVYGCKSLKRPKYDIERELADISERPPSLTSAPLKSFVVLNPSDAVEGLFSNSLWLYGALALVAGLLGWMAIGMLKK